MAQQANITVFDGAGTPVTHTLTAVSVERIANKSVASWREISSSVPIDAQIRMTTSLERLKSGVFVAKAKVEVPVMETIGAQNASGYTAAPKVAYVDTYEQTGMFSPRSTQAGRRLARQIMINVMGNVSTSVPAATSGPLPDLFDSLVHVS